MEGEIVSKRFVVTPEIRSVLRIGEDVVAWCAYWNPSGDEAECYRLHQDGRLEGGTSDWRAYQALERLNYEEMKPYHFGSSESEPEYVVFVDYLQRQASFLPSGRANEKFAEIKARLPR